MKKNYRLFLLLGFGLCLSGAVEAQKDRYLEIYPERPFSALKASEEGYTYTFVNAERKRRKEGDESGLPWSGELQSNYQKAKYQYEDGNLMMETHLREDGRRTRYLEYGYLDGLLSGIDEFHYEMRMPPGEKDSLWEGELLYSYRYLYRNNKQPFDKLIIVNQKPQPLRILHSYDFDTLGRLVHERIEHQGAKSRNGNWELMPSKELVLTEYEEDARYRRYYSDMHKMHDSEESLYNEEGQVLVTKFYTLRNERRVQTGFITYNYSDKQLFKSERTIIDPETRENKIVETCYYSYHAYGLPERILREEGDEQEILYFMYTTM